MSNADRPTVLGRDLHEALEVKSKYADWFKNMCAYGFEEGKDYLTFSKNLENGGRTIDHQLTIAMAKELCMIQRTEKESSSGRKFLYDKLAGIGMFPQHKMSELGEKVADNDNNMIQEA